MTTTLVAMKRADGTMDSIIHLPDGGIVKPAADGTVMIPVQYVVALMMGGYEMTVPGDMQHIPFP
jgi:hypothetical protein